ncbi:MAG: hypothetical protein FWE09_00640 [Treponema sp.]|nr:hypothetical protein [Treponema sp.]
MTIAAATYQPVQGVDYARFESFQARPAVAPEVSGAGAPQGASIDAVTVIDILLGQLDKLNEQLARAETQLRSASHEARSEAMASFERAAPQFAMPEASARETSPLALDYADMQDLMNAALEQYAQARADVQAAGLLEGPFAQPNVFAGMLFGINA